MIADTQSKQMQIEAREINYILPAYIRQYLQVSKNEDPERIIFPMFPSAPHPYKPGVLIPIEWIPMTDPMATEIAEDGEDVPEVTPAQEAALDAQDEAAKELATQVKKLQADEAQKSNEPEGAKSPIKEATKPSERVPKPTPGGDIGAGHPDSLGSRDARLDKKIAQDLKPEADVDESMEKPAKVEKPKE